MNSRQSVLPEPAESMEHPPRQLGTARYSREQMVDFLLSQGAEIKNALHMAACTGNRTMAELFISRGADVNEPHRGSGHTPLHLAVEHRHKELASLLVSRGADIFKKDRSGRTCLDLAHHIKHPEIIAILSGSRDSREQVPH